ncbi:MAG: DUF1080 domain-containing protein, partial [Candidatus Omnitrophica bacterium]|nr:DUF1080 domain-containing protein [Candidatus Omnitrophota bacterium]
QFDPLKVDPYMGDYEGEYLAVGRDPVPADAKVIAEGSDTYRVMISTKAVHDVFWSPRIEITGRRTKEGMQLEGDSSGLTWEGQIKDGSMVARVRSRYGGTFALHHVLRESPTAGLKPPKGAIVLLPFEEGATPDMSEWDNSTWKSLADGSMQVGEGDNHTKREFGDVRLHLEFCIPYEPEGRGQDRGNSGVYFQDRYEPQVLDSYGLIPRAGDCGAIYEIAVPPVNACLPPLSWQTYDIVFRAPRFTDKGDQSEFPWITVELNGVKLHERQWITHSTVGGKEGFVAKGPFRLQDHGHPVRYRNIWAQELNIQQ